MTAIAYLPRCDGGPDLRGSTSDRRRRREWLITAWRADVDALDPGLPVEVPRGQGVAACRCYRCGALLTVDTVTADRIVPGCQGGRYNRGNIRPACSTCNKSTGGALAHRKAVA